MAQVGSHNESRTGAIAAISLVLGYLVENGSAGHYKLSATGPSDAILVDDGGTLAIDTTGTAAATIYAAGGTTNFRIFR